MLGVWLSPLLAWLGISLPCFLILVLIVVVIVTR